MGFYGLAVCADGIEWAAVGVDGIERGCWGVDGIQWAAGGVGCLFTTGAGCFALAGCVLSNCHC
jgi:hypothetical protein